MNIDHYTLPDGLQEFVLARVTEGGYQSVDDYVGELIRADHRQAAKARLEAEVLNGIRSDKAPLTDQDWADIRAEVIRRHEARSQGAN